MRRKKRKPQIKKKAKPDEEKAWADFVSWCTGRGLDAVPANPWTLAAYARWLEPDKTFPAITKIFAAIAKVHATKSRKRPERDPTVIRTLGLIETRAKAKKQAAKEKRVALFPDDDVLNLTPPGKPKKTPKKKAAVPGKSKKSRPGLSASPKLVSKRKLKK